MAEKACHAVDCATQFGLTQALGLMKPTSTQHNAFFAHEPIDGVLFKHNDAVLVAAGEHAGQVGSLISIEDLGSDPVFLVEFGSGTDAYIQQSHLRAHEA